MHTEDEPLVIDDIAYDHENQRNADPCTSRGCMWSKSSDGKVYVPYVIASHFCELMFLFQISDILKCLYSVLRQ